MNMAVFFQKHGKSTFVSLFRSIYGRLCLRSNRAKIKYLRDAGAEIGNGCTIQSVDILGTEPFLVEIGDRTYFSGTATKIFTHDGGVSSLFYMGITDKKFDYFGRVKIGSNCFIGHGCTIMKHVTIGDNCVIGAGSVVAKSIPPNSVACGVPARVVCTVEEYFQKNQMYFDDTVGWNLYKKRRYIEEHMHKYEDKRLDLECKY